jgi:hypothetical protein
MAKTNKLRKAIKWIVVLLALVAIILFPIISALSIYR